MLPFVYINGDYLSQSDAQLHVSDLSVLRGYGVFDYFRYVDGSTRFLSDHLRRFRDSATGLGLSLSLDDKGLVGVINELIERNGDGDGGIRLVLTGGYAEDGYTPLQPNLLALPYAHRAPDPALYERGCKVILHDYERQLPRIKTIDYIEGIRIQPRLRARGADYPLYVDRRGNVRESDRSNYMIVSDGTLISPVDDILLGVTRLHVLRLARQLGIRVAERAVSVAELLAADEVLICSSVKGVMPVRRVDQTVIGATKYDEVPYLVGKATITGRLMTGWETYVRS